jgi:hypothetical protein
MLELPEEQWEPYLAHLATDQPAVAEALREILASRKSIQSQGFLEGGVARIHSDDEAGTQLGPYTIASLIGRGGMGEVWLALRSDGRFEGKFAVKFLDSYRASPAALDRFRREGSLLARLVHPHIARLIDAGLTQGGRPYLILDYVQGEPIDQYCRTHSLSIEARVRLLLDVLAALAHAHSNLVIHRDIKPSNILVSADGVVKLLDFGIAKLLGVESVSGDGPQLTRMEDSAFTPEYAAPEQILGEMPSTATDVYQVGILMFMLLAGDLPSPASGTRAERIKSALEGEARHLSEVAPAHLRQGLRGDLDAIVSKALRKLPRERYATAAALADDLKRYLNHEPVAARANLLGYRVSKFVRRYRAAVIGSSVAVLALIAIAAFALLQMREAQLERDRVRDQAKRAEKQSEFVTLMLSTVGTKPISAEQLLDAGARLLSEHYTADPQFRVDAMVNLSSRYDDLGLTQKEYALLQGANHIAQQLNQPALIAQTECWLSGTQIDLGNLDLAASLATAGSERLAKLKDPDARFVEDCLEARANLLSAQNKPAEAVATAEKALALLVQQGDATHDLRYSDLLGRISGYYKDSGDIPRAFDYSERALAASEQSGLGDTDGTMIDIHNVASSLLSFGEVNRACEREKQVIDRLQSTGRSLITAMSVVYGNCLVRQGRAAEALAWHEQGIKSAASEDDAALQMYALQGHARALVELKRFAEAGTELDRVDAIASEHHLTGSFQADRALLQRADLLLAQQRYEQARQVIDGLLRTVESLHGSQGLLLAPASLRESRIALAQGRPQDAQDWANKALQTYERQARDPAASADVGETQLVLAQAKRMLGEESGSRTTAHLAAVALTASLGADNALTKQALALQ